MMLIWEQLVLVVLVEKKQGGQQGEIQEEPKFVLDKPKELLQELEDFLEQPKDLPPL